jgi:hypothetical protein
MQPCDSTEISYMEHTVSCGARDVQSETRAELALSICYNVGRLAGIFDNFVDINKTR